MNVCTDPYHYDKVAYMPRSSNDSCEWKLCVMDSTYLVYACNETLL